MIDYVLNPDLLGAIEQTIGHARVINAGQPLEGYYASDPTNSLNRRLKIVRRGETYVTCCPFCNDRRERLAINHRYGVHDPNTGFRGTELWKCYNEECQNDQRHRGELRSRLLDRLVYRGLNVRPPDIKTVSSTTLEPCEFPGLLVSLNELPLDHRAVLYVRHDRGFDPVELSDVWGAAYADSVPSRSQYARTQDRLVIPVRRHGAMIGWQSRYLGELNWKVTGVPKYLTFFPKGLAVYGIDEAASADVVVLVEGALDVWRYGPGAVSGFGKKLSRDQARILAAELNGRTLVLVPDANDPQAFDSFCDSGLLVREMGHTGKIGIAPLPVGSDPAKLSRERLRKLTAVAAAGAE